MKAVMQPPPDNKEQPGGKSGQNVGVGGLGWFRGGGLGVLRGLRGFEGLGGFDGF